jgi:hypothetical protein
MATPKHTNGAKAVAEAMYAIPRNILTKARVEMDRTIDRQVEPYRQKISELERKRADIDEELKGLYMIVGFYDSVRMQNAEPSLAVA